MKVLSFNSMALIAAACFAVSCASPYREADRGVEGTLRSTITDRDVDVHVERGLVTLDGKVNTEADRQRIELLARRTAGVVAVRNKLKVKLPTPGEYGALPGSTALRTAPDTAVVTESPSVVVQSPTVVTIPTPTGAVLPAIVIPQSPSIKVQPVASTDQIIANRIAAQLSHDVVALSELDTVTISINGVAASVHGMVDSEAKRDALLAALKRAGGITTIYDQLQVK
jgi:hypothetical protein